MSVQDLIMEYLSNGGLFNPELANHNDVRDLLIKAAIKLDRLDKQFSFAAGYISTTEGFTSSHPEMALQFITSLGEIDGRKK